MEIVMMIVGLLSLVCSLGVLVCWILVIITGFQKEESPLMGILSIVLCSPGALVIGWIKNKEWGISKLMMIFTALFVGCIIFQVIGLVVAGAAAQNGQF